MAYDIKPLRAPTVSGATLLLMGRLMESRLFGAPLAAKFFKAAGIERFRSTRIDADPLYYPRRDAVLAVPGGDDRGTNDVPAIVEPEPAPPGDAGFRYPTMYDYAAAYRDGSLDPVTVAKRFIHVLEHQERGNPPLYAFVAWKAEEIMQQAEESLRRIREGAPRSIFEGVPIAVKDEFDQRGFPTTLGTSFLVRNAAGNDATVVAKLRAAGALLVGKTNMHEIGLGVTGLNPFYGTPVNPYAPWRYPGGSSSGSGSVVGSGLCPAAVGADGGGSIRIPSAFCGVFGLKPTYGRISSHGEGPLVWSVGSVGPIAATARDLAIMYQLMAGPDPRQPATLGQPPATIDGFDGDVEGLRIGIFQPWFEDGADNVVTTVRALLHQFTQAGAELVDVEVPHLDQLRTAHLVTITSEMASAFQPYYRDHHSDFGNDIRATMALAQRLTSRDYVRAQMARRIAMRDWDRIWETVDVVATPTTAILPPRLPKDRLLSGVSDLGTMSKIMRFATPANMLGLPAISVPAGFITARSRRFWLEQDEHDDDGNVYSQVPVGLQFIGPHWSEPLLLRLARVSEEMVERPRPRVYLSAHEAHNPVEAGRDRPVNE